MHLSPQDISQQTHLAFQRHQDLIAAAQRRRIIDQATAGQTASRSHGVSTWRHRLGQQLIAWGKALQASSQTHPPAVHGPRFAGTAYTRSASPHRSES